MIGHRDGQEYLLLYPIIVREVKLKSGLDWLSRLVGLIIVLACTGHGAIFAIPVCLLFLSDAPNVAVKSISGCCGYSYASKSSKYTQDV